MYNYIVKRHASVTTNCKLFSPNRSMITTHFEIYNTISALPTTHCRSLIKSKDFLIFNKAMTYATALMKLEMIKLYLMKSLCINGSKNGIRINYTFV